LRKTFAQPLRVPLVQEGAHLHREVACGRIRTGQQFDAHGSDAHGHQVKRLRRVQRKINDPIFDKRAAVGDAHVHRAAIRQVRHAHNGVKGQCAMRRGQLVHVVGFPVCRAASVKRDSVPRGQALFGIASRF